LVIPIVFIAMMGLLYVFAPQTRSRGTYGRVMSVGAGVMVAALLSFIALSRWSLSTAWTVASGLLLLEAAAVLIKSILKLREKPGNSSGE
jgi:hypothetical protein